MTVLISPQAQWNNLPAGRRAASTDQPTLTALPGLQKSEWDIYAGNYVQIEKDPVKGSVLRHRAGPSSATTRAEQVTATPNVQLGQTIWIGFDFRGGPYPTPPWQFAWQFKNDSTGSPPLGMAVNSGEAGGGSLRAFASGGLENYLLTTNWTAWNRMVFGVTAARSPNGIVEVWVNGVQVFRDTNWQSRDSSGAGAGTGGTIYSGRSNAYLKFGIYGAALSSERNHYFCNMIVATTRAEVMGASVEPVPVPPPAPPTLSAIPGDAVIDVTRGAITGARSGDVWQLRRNGIAVPAAAALALGTATFRDSGVPNGAEQSYGARVGNPAANDWGAWTPTAQEAKATPQAAVPLPEGILFQRPNEDVVAVAGSTWGRASSGRAYWEHVNSPVNRSTPLTDPAFTSGDVISSFAGGKILELGFTSVARPAQGFKASWLCVHMEKTGALGAEFRLRNAPGGGLTLVGAIASSGAQPRQTFMFPIPLSMVDTQARVDALEVQLLSVMPAGLSGGETWTPELWVEHEPNPVPVSDVTVTPTSRAFSGIAGGAAPAAQTVALSASVATSFTFQESIPWMTVSVDQLVTPATMTLTPVTAGMSAGSRNGAVTVTDQFGQVDVINVSLTLTAAVDLTANPTSLDFGEVEAGFAQQVTQQLIIDNVGGLGDTSFTVDVGVAPITVSGGTSAPATLTLMLDASAYAAGGQAGSISIVGALETISVPWTLLVVDPPPPIDPPPPDPPPPLPPPVIDRAFHGSGWPADLEVTIVPRVLMQAASMREVYDPQEQAYRVVMVSDEPVATVTTDEYGNWTAELPKGHYWAVGVVDGEFKYVGFKVE